MRASSKFFHVALVVVAASARAQADDPAAADVAVSPAPACDLGNLQPQAPWNLSIQASVADALERSGACLAQGDTKCATAAIDEIAAASLRVDEQALVAIQRAELANTRGDVEAAERALRDALALPELSPFVERDVAEKTAAMLVRKGESAEVLRLLAGRFSCDTWTADALTMRALAYEHLAATALALENFAAAIRMYPLEGRAVPAGLEERHRALAAGYDPSAPPRDESVPLLRINPNYPERALRRRLDGWVQLSYTVTDMGTVADVTVVASSDKIFEPAAVAAFERWRYAPKFENGLPVPARDQTAILRFCLDEDCSRR